MFKSGSKWVSLLVIAVVFGLFALTPAYAQGNQMQVASPKAYVGDFKGNDVTVIDTATNTVLTTIPVPAGPDSMAITPDGQTVYVSSTGDTKISVIDTATDKVTGTIEVGANPYGLAITPDGKTLLAGSVGSGMMDFIDLP